MDRLVQGRGVQFRLHLPAMRIHRIPAAMDAVGDLLKRPAMEHAMQSFILPRRQLPERHHRKPFRARGVVDDGASKST